MHLRTLIFTIVFGILSATVITGCSDNEKSKQENGHGHSHH